jgi:signal transduction histidine kinase
MPIMRIKLLQKANMKLVIIILTLVLLQLACISAFATDTLGLKAKLNFCYELNKQRDPALTAEAKKLLPFAKKLPKTEEAVRIYTLVGRGFLNVRDLDSCPKYFQLAYNNLSARVSADAEAHLNLSSGWVDYAFGKSNTSMQKYSTAYKLYSKVNDPIKTAWVLNNMTQVMNIQQRFDKALEYAQKAVEITGKSADTVTYAYNLQTLGEVYLLLERYQEALNQYQVAERILNNSKIWTEVTLNNIKLSSCYNKMQQYRLAIKCGLKADSLIKKYDIKLYTGFNSSNLAESYIAINDVQRSLYHLERALAEFKKSELSDIEPGIYNTASIIYGKLKQYDKALYYLELYLKASVIIADSLQKTSENGQLAKFDLLVKEHEVENLKTLNEQQKELAAAQQFRIRLVTSFSIALVIALLFLFWLFRRTKKAEANLQKQRLITENQNQELKKQNELQLMTIGIVGHDLRGPLSSAITLRSILNKILDDADIKSAKELSTLLFDSLERINVLANNLVQWVLSAQSGINLNFKQVVIKEAIDNLIQVFETELAKKQIKIINQVNPTIEVYADAACVETILRNVIQNAIKFTNEGRNVTVSATDFPNEQGLITLTVKDEGVGMPPEILEKLNDGKRMITLGTKGEKGNGLGLIMIQTLLSLNKGKMQISSEVGVGTSFSVLLPKSKTS